MPTKSVLFPVDLFKLSDWLAIAAAISIPWSTSATGILVGLWLLALVPTLDWMQLRRLVLQPAGGLPIALILLACVGTLWAEVSWHDRWGGLGGFVKLLPIPLFMVQFRRSENGYRVFVGFLIGCLALL